MSKKRTILAIFTMVGIVVPFVLLRFGFCTSVCKLIEQALLAAFTGCVFALFSGVAVWVDESRQIKVKQGELLANLYNQFGQFSVGDYASYVPGSLEANRRNIVNLYQLLHCHLSENVWINSPEVAQLKDDIFDLSLCILELDRYYDDRKRPTKIEFDVKLGEINRLKGSCINLIPKVQELF